MMVPPIRAAKKHRAEIVISGYAKCDENLNIVHRHLPGVRCGGVLSAGEKQALLDRAHEKNLLKYAWRNIFERKMIARHEILFDERVRIGTEILFVLHALHAAGRIVALDETLYYYRDNPDSLTQRKHKLYLEESMRNQHEEKMKFYRKHGLSDRFLKGLHENVIINWLPMLLADVIANNGFNNRAESLKRMKNVIDSPMIRESLANTPLFNSRLPAGKQFIILASRAGFYRPLWLFYRYRKSFLPAYFKARYSTLVSAFRKPGAARK